MEIEAIMHLSGDKKIGLECLFSFRIVCFSDLLLRFVTLLIQDK